MIQNPVRDKILNWIGLGEARKGAIIFDAPSSSYKICSSCIMDTTDAEIVFDENGVCNHCHDYDQSISNLTLKGAEGKNSLEKKIQTIKKDGLNRKYDCILGLSGGVDSTYVAYLCKKVYGLRPLAVHLDNGWNSEIAVRNIQHIVEILDIDLYTEVLDWKEFKEIQVAFLKSSTPDSEIPTDHAISAVLYDQAVKNKIHWIMDGSNIATEIMLPTTWSHGHNDWKYIREIFKKFGTGKIKSFPRYNFFQFLVGYPRLKKIIRFPILNYVDFDKNQAMEILKSELNWQPYGGKHYESIYTRFFQGYILPTKFGFDKRRAHLSCLVKGGQITRDLALAEIQKPALDESLQTEDRIFVTKKLGLSNDEFNNIMNLPRKTFWDYPSYENDIRKLPLWMIVFTTKMLLRFVKSTPSTIAKRAGMQEPSTAI